MSTVQPRRKFLPHAHFGWLVAAAAFWVTPLGGAVIQVKGLFSGAAVIAVDGDTQLLRVGTRTADGLELVAATSRVATLRWQGQARQLGLNEWWGDAFERRRSHARALMLKQPNGAFEAAGTINDHPVRFEWSPASNYIAVSGALALKLGLPVATAPAMTAIVGAGGSQSTEAQVSLVTLDRLAIGSVVVRNVDVALVAGLATEHVLLGHALADYFRITQQPAHLALEVR